MFLITIISHLKTGETTESVRLGKGQLDREVKEAGGRGAVHGVHVLRDSDMEGHPNKVFKVRRLALKSGKLRKLKKWMDEVCPSRGIRRVESTELSDRKLPEGVPKWAVSKNFGKSTGPTAENGGGDEEQDSSFLDLG
ncbi:Hypp2838 [Branchiostoma lanceolatum]|uniref:Hypp2838 protein n=1 Tax=Branchiostoma lanceolatum TaxID=7740 RepID=A0A8J9ZXI8_BRALA|nr:Hypp2838 [Branchiostoma lanceolatum]